MKYPITFVRTFVVPALFGILAWSLITLIDDSYSTTDAETKLQRHEIALAKLAAELTDREAEIVSTSTPEVERVEVQSPALTRIEELTSLLDAEKKCNLNLSSDLEKSQKEIEELEIELRQLKSILAKVSQNNLVSRVDWEDIRDSISPPGSEIPQEEIRNALVSLSAKWPIDWGRIPQSDLAEIGVLAARLEKECEAIREEWRVYDKTVVSVSNKDLFWSENRDKLSERKEKFLTDLRKVCGDEVDLLDL